MVALPVEAIDDARRAFVLQLLHDGPVVTIEDLVGRPAWHQQAACAEYPKEMFFPGRGESAEPARAVCAGCAVFDQCRAWTLTQDTTRLQGVWAGRLFSPGLTARRQRQPRSSEAVAEAGTCAVCGSPGDELQREAVGLLDRACLKRWRDKRRPEGDAFEAWATDRRAFLELGRTG